MTRAVDNIAPFYPTQRVIDTRYPLWPPVTVVSVREIAPREWRFDWELRIAPQLNLTPITGSAPTTAYKPVGG